MYAKPIKVTDPNVCSFYHRMEIPGFGTVGDQWDVRDAADEYLGNLDFRGKRVLDVGTAAGFLTFEMERRGAEVVSFDMESGRAWDLVPQAATGESIEEYSDRCVKEFEALRNAYWFAHQRLQSKAKVYYGDIYNLPQQLGNFDIVVFGMILGHLRDPFLALHSGSRLCRGNVLVTNQSGGRKDRWYRQAKEAKGAQFIPTRENGIRQAWWALSDQCISQMLEVLGFDTIERHTSHPLCLVDNREQSEECRTTITQRVAGEALAVMQC